MSVQIENNRRKSHMLEDGIDLNTRSDEDSMCDSQSSTESENGAMQITNKALELLDEKMDPMLILQSLVIDSTSPKYGSWNILLVLINAITCLIYPYAVAYGF